MDRLNTKLVLTCALGAAVIAVMLWSVGPERLTELVSGAQPGHLAAAALAIGTAVVWIAAVGAWSMATYAARVVEEDDIDYTDTESDAP